jgi:uncharacterized membrane protein
MLSSVLMGLVGGQRAMTPLAAVAVAAASGRLRTDSGAPKALSHPLVAAGAVALAIAEVVGDKRRTAPDRIVPVGLLARFTTSAIAGAAVASRRQRWTGAAVGGATAVVASFPGWRLRLMAMSRRSQMSTGLLEDAIVLAAAAAIVGRASTRG